MSESAKEPEKSSSNPLAFWHWKLHWQILLGLIVGVVLGILTGRSAVAAGAGVTDRWDFMFYDLIGDMFLNGLKLIVVPIVMSSLIVSIAGIGKRGNFGRLGLKTLFYYMCTSLIAILIGLTLVNIVKPGVTDPENPILNVENTEQYRESFANESAKLTSRTEGKSTSDFLNTFRAMIPANVVKAAAEGQLLGLIVVSLLVGYFLTRLEGPLHDTLVNVVQAIYEVTLLVTDLVLKFAPLGVLALIARTLSDSYASLAQDDRLTDFVTVIVKFFLTTLGALGVHFLIVLPLILLLIAKVNPIRHYRAMAPALMTAFSTASSSATLPVTMECVEDNAGVSNRTTSFVLPLGATVNMDGTALYECLAAMFIAQAYGIEISIGQQFFIVLIALLTSIGVAGVPSASLVAIVIILKSVGVPMEGLAIILVVDRLLDMCRTAVNIFSDSCGAVTIAASEGEQNLLANA